MNKRVTVLADNRLSARTLIQCGFLMAMTLAVSLVTTPSMADDKPDPLCNFGNAEKQFQLLKSLDMSGTDVRFAKVVRALPLMDMTYSQVALPQYSNKYIPWQTQPFKLIYPDPVDSGIVNGKKVQLKRDLSGESKCLKSMGALGKITPANNSTYACALLHVDVDCLTGTGSQPTVTDPSIAFRAVAIIIVRGTPVCTGLLRDENHFETARHCFINMGGGKNNYFNRIAPMDWSVETVDGMRQIIIKDSEIDKLNKAFKYEQDAVILNVTTSALPGAKPLPKTKKIEPVSTQLLWLAGPVPYLSESLARRQFNSLNDSAPLKPDWRDAIRWSRLLSAQCQIKAVIKSCIFHSCQTFEGYSGSPMITRVVGGAGSDTGIIEYVGVHSGTPGSKGCSIWAPELNAIQPGNYNVGTKGS